VKSLAGLIRLVNWRVDEKRRELSGAQDVLDARRKALADMADELKREQAAARASPEGAQAYANYARQYLVRRAQAGEAILAAEAEVERVREELSSLFLELKQAEITQANRDKREAERLAKLEQTALDEMGIARFQRARKATEGGDGRS
jgi:flagellar export protein FliJ